MIVKVIAYSGTVAAPISNRIADENLHMLKQPCLSSEAIQVGSSAVSTKPAPAGTALIEVQVQGGKTICAEVNPQGKESVATQDSPWIKDGSVLHFGPGWTLSLVEAQ